jgi:AcrR family transcriptional regulator
MGRYARAMAERPYHHGNLRAALLDAALDAVREHGPSGWSLRDLARRAGVSHAAPTHHFRDKRGLLTVIATDGYRRLAADLDTAWAETASFREVGVAYVRFAVEHRAAFEVMFRPDLLHRTDRELAAAMAASTRRLYGPIGDAASEQVDGRDGFDALLAALAAWSLVHGFATLWLAGNLPGRIGDDPEQAAREVASYLFRPLPKGLTRS